MDVLPYSSGNFGHDYPLKKFDVNGGNFWTSLEKSTSNDLTTLDRLKSLFKSSRNIIIRILLHPKPTFQHALCLRYTTTVLKSLKPMTFNLRLQMHFERQPPETGFEVSFSDIVRADMLQQVNGSLSMSTLNSSVSTQQQQTSETQQNGSLQSANNNNQKTALASSLNAVSMMPMPLGVSLSGLTTIPVLCPVNGATNIGGTNSLQSIGGMMAPQGLVLLNVGGNNVNNIPQIIGGNTQVQQQVAIAPQPNAVVQQVAPTTQQGQQMPAAEPAANAAISSVMETVPQVPLQPSIMSQSSPAAYMLVPIHHIPNNPPVVQQLPTENAESLQMNINANLNLPSASGSSQMCTPVPLTTPAVPTASATAVSELATVMSVPSQFQATVPFILPQSISEMGSSVDANPQTCANPINDPHISSSVQTSAHSGASHPSNMSLQDRQEIDAGNASMHAISLTSTADTSSCYKNPATTKLKEDSLNDSSASGFKQPGHSDTGSKKPEKRKKGPAPKLDGNERCQICTDKASGFHYGVLTCEGCKGFFRRCIIKTPQFKCKENNQCQMDTYMRRKCQACRLRKCREAGMKDEGVVSEVPSGSKSKRMKKDASDSIGSPFVAHDLFSSDESVSKLSPQQQEIVEMLQANENRYQWPTQEDVERITPWVETGDTHLCRAARFAHFTEFAILIVQLVVEFTKQLPGFLTVSREDQILLLKACTIEVMLLRAAKQYDKHSKAINFLNGKYYDKSSFYRAGMQVEFVDPIFDFCSRMAKLGLDEAEYALLVAINTFSADRPNLKDLKKIEELQDQYVDLLRDYLRIHHPDDPLMFPRTLMKLVELRSLNNYHSDQIFALKVQDKQLPPLLAEMWDM